MNPAATVNGKMLRSHTAVIEYGEPPKVKVLLEEGTLNPTPDKVHDPKFQDNEFFDPRDVVQVKYEMLRRVSIENASVTDATEEYGVSSPTYYQNKANFDKGGVAALVPRKRGPRGPHKLQGEALAFVDQQNRRRRACASARARQADSTEIRCQHTPPDDRAGGRWKKNVAMTSAKDDSAERSIVVTQYETLRRAALGDVLPPEGPVWTDALSPPWDVGMGARLGRHQPIAPADRLSSIQLESA